MKQDNPIIVQKLEHAYETPLCLLLTLNEESLICSSDGTETVGDEDGQW